MNRAEHMAWCKKRALQYLEPGPYFSIENAWASMVSDLAKHDETHRHAAIGLGMSMLIAGRLSTAEKMREFIEGFN